MSSDASRSTASPQNRLGRETSPYLLQHKHNPVAWWPWGPEALAEAQRTNRPILLSVGYAACHWCHVMAHESFEDDATAAVMNELFVNIKVDREERPDIDQIYMSALHHLGEHGGWPLTMFLTPEGAPVWGGTYFPKTSRYGKPAFVDVLREVSRVFREEPDKIGQNRDALMARLSERARPEGKLTVGVKELDQLARQLGGAFDQTHGGLRGAPKFPNAAIYELMWRAGMREEARQHGAAAAANPPPAERRGGSANEVSRGGGPTPASQTPPTPDPSPPLASLAGGGESQAARATHHDARQTNAFFRTIEHTLERICEGGITDHLGGGFSRYSVDERWLVPHFEKMLYDNAQLLELLALAHHHSGNPLFAQRARETVGWLVREMTTEGGAFCASLDADSEGEEGKFYVWSHDEVLQHLGEDDGAFFAQHYDVTPAGNFEGHNILNRLGRMPRSENDEKRLAGLREKLLAARGARVRPGLDDKVLADWNGLMIAALVNAGTMLGEPDWIARAGRAFDFIVREMSRGDRLGHSWREGRLVFPGLASDFAAMIRAALALYEATGTRRYLDKALDWQVALDSHYANDANGGYFLTADDAEGLVVRPASTTDEAMSNPNALAAQNLIRLATLGGDDTWRERADALIEGVLSVGRDQILSHAALLNAVDMRINAAEIVLTGKDQARLAEAALRLPFLNRIVLRAPSRDALPASHPAQDKIAAVKGAAAFICIGERCSLPVTQPEAIAEAVKGMRAAPA